MDDNKGGQQLDPSLYTINYSYLTNNIAVLVSNAPAGPFNYWNGGNGGNPGTPGGWGGSGTWNLYSTNWTNAQGNTTAAWSQGRDADLRRLGTAARWPFADNVIVDGIQFARDGYTLAFGGGAITLDGSKGPVIFDVTGTNVIDVDIRETTGGTRLIKNGLGELVLTSENNIYSGGTEIREGTLTLGNSANGIGIVRGPITGSAGTTLNVYSDGSVNFDNVINQFGGTVNFIGHSGIATISTNSPYFAGQSYLSGPEGFVMSGTLGGTTTQ